jgi:SNF2 family DNA or RNA helicase
VKNPASSAARHIRKVEARTRLALTGTPVENNLEDLWTLFDWLIPGPARQPQGLSGTLSPGDREERRRGGAGLLNARIRPFVLRRTKAEVAADLPPKTEIVETVTLGPGQRGLYETIRLTMDARVQRAIAERGLAGSRITILTHSSSCARSAATRCCWRLGARGPQMPDACQGALAEGQFMADGIVWVQGLRFRL